MFEDNQNIEIKIGTEKSFGITFAIFFLIISFYPLIFNNQIRFWAILLAILFFFLAYIMPKIFVIPNKLWFELGMTLGGFFSPIFMSFIYFLIVVPTGLIMKTLGKDILRKEIKSKAKTYWIIRKNPPGSMRNQF